MKVIVLRDRDWELAKKKLEAHLHATGVKAELIKAYKRLGLTARPLGEAHIRKEHIGAIRLARVILSQ